ncbi:MAG: hypothetical protein ACFFDF_21725 [Candidatus Odinarchaeota archaeon]
MKTSIKINIIGLTLFCIIFFGITSTGAMAIGNYNVALRKGTKIYTVTQYDDAGWKATINSSTTPSNWFEGYANQTGAKSKNTIKGWNYVTWETYDVFISLFLSILFKSEDLIPLLALLNSQGYNESSINTNYTNSYNLWFGLSAIWNFTVGDFKEDPSIANGPILIFQNPTDIDDILNDYNNLSANLNNNVVIQLSGYTFPILDSNDFLWLFIFNGLALGSPFHSYLEELITSLNCTNATVDNNRLFINRVGETNYTVEIIYNSEGIMESFLVKDVADNTIYQIVSSNSDSIFYTVIVILLMCIGGFITYLVIWKRKTNRKRKRKIAS